VRTAAKTLSNHLSTITTRQEFTTKMINTLEDGAANLVNADLNEEGANMLMLQTRQSLGTTSLSLASQAAQSVMRLF
jgi:flagellin